MIFSSAVGSVAQCTDPMVEPIGTFMIRRVFLPGAHAVETQGSLKKGAVELRFPWFNWLQQATQINKNNSALRIPFIGFNGERIISKEST